MLALVAAAPAQAATGDIFTAAGNGADAYSGDGGQATSASLRSPGGVAFSASDLFIADFDSDTVRKVDASGVITTIAGTGTNGYSGDGGPATAARLNQPADVAADAAGNVYIADWMNHRIRKVSPGGTITTVAGTGTFGYSGDGGPAFAAELASPVGLELDGAGNVYVTDFGNHTLRKITPSGFITTVAGTGVAGSSGDGGPASSAELNQPGDSAIDGAGNIFVDEFAGHRVRKIAPGGTITTVAGTGTAGYSGDGGPATAARLSAPAGVDIDSQGNLFVAEYGNHVVRQISPSGMISRVAGTPGSAGFSGDGGPGTSARLDNPVTAVLSPGGDFYISDLNNHRVRRLDGIGSPDAPSFSSTSPASPSSSNSPRVLGTAPAGSTVRLYTDSACTSAVAATGTAAQFASPGLSVTVANDSTTTFYGTAQDAAGNLSGCSGTGITYVEDSTAPAVPAIGTQPSSPGNDSTPTWAFSGEAGASFECRIVRGATVVSDWAACSSPNTYDLSAQVDGSYTFSVRARDAAGNTGASAGAGYQLDRSAPTTSIGSSPATPASGRNPSWSFSSEAGAALQCRLTRGATVVSAWAACASPKAYDLTGQPDGTYTFEARATDAAGNTGAPAGSNYQLDTTAPAAPAFGSRPSSPGNDATPTWSFSGEAGAAFECRVMRGATLVSDWASCSDPKTYDLSSQPDGTYSFSVRARDAAGNTGAAASDDYVLDTAAPAVPSIDSAPVTPASSTLPSWSFSGEAGAAFECRLQRGATVVADWAACSSPRAYDLSAQPDGSYTFLVRARDAAGNTGASAGSGYQLDTTAPPAPSIDSAPLTPGNSSGPTWSFSSEAGAAVQCRLTRGATVVSDWASCSAMKAYDLSGQPDGTYTFEARATDGAGNTGAPAGSNYRFDTTAPAAPAFGSRPTSPGNDVTPSWSFSGEAGASFECRVMRGATLVSDWALCSDPDTVDLSSQPEGTYSFSVRARDAAGNAGAAASDDYVLDTTDPAVPSIDSAPASPGNDSSPAWGFSAEPGASVECRLTRGATVVSDWASCSDPKTYDLSSQPDGSYSFSVRARDAAGNTGAAAGSAYQLDTAAPAAPSFGSQPATPGNSASPSWSFSAEPGASVECRLIRGATVVSDWASCSGSKSYDLSSEPDGGYTFSTRARDGAGNLGAAANSGYQLDRSSPSAPSIDSQPSSPASDTTPDWSFSGEAGAAFECRLLLGATVVSDWASCSDPKSFDLSTDPDGLYTFSVRARDAAGNTGAAASASYQLDTSAPGAPAIDSSPSTPGNDSSPDWGFSGEAGASIQCRLERGATVVSDWAACSDPKSFDLSGEPDGDYRFSVQARDAAGNTGAASTSNYELDTTAPAAPTIDSEPETPASDHTPSWTFSGPGGGAAVECRLTRGASVVSDWAACSSPRAYDLSSQPDGDYDFAVRARDDAGNLSPTAGSSYTLDSSIPAVPTIDSSPGALGSGTSPSWSFSSADSGAAFECRLERGATTVSDWAACASPKSFDLSGEPDGNYSFSVRAVNRARTRSDAAGSAYQLDRTAPAAPAIDSSPASPASGRSPGWSFSGEAGASFECRLERGGSAVANWASCSSPKDFSLSGQPDGTYSFLVRATDAVGNTGAPATSGDYVLDTTAPGAPSIDSAPSSPGASQTPAWGFSGEAGATLECRLSQGATVVEDWTACSSPRSYDLSSRPDGAYTFAARARDAAGNAGAEASSDYQLDTTGVAVQIDSGPGAAGNGSSPEWSFSAESGASFECRLASDDGVLEDWDACTSPKSFDLSGQPDGAYTFSVRASDALSNQGEPTDARYVLDTLAPGSPSVNGGPASPSRERAPTWAFSGETGASFECRLEGAGVLVADWRGCTSPSRFSLGGQSDGRYTLSVRATDAAGNTGSSGSGGFDLDTTPPDVPSISGPGASGDDPTPRWSFDGESGASFECRLSRDGRALGEWAACASPRGFDLTGEPDGSYSLAVRATDEAGNVGAPGSSDYELARSSDNDDTDDNAVPPDSQLPSGQAPSAAQPAGGGDDAGAVAAPSRPGGGESSASSEAGPQRKPSADDGMRVPFDGPHHDLDGAGSPENQSGTKILKALGGAVKAVAAHADDSVFPGLLLGIVMGFFAVQNRIDRNDPKLRLAPVFADPDLEFNPPSGD